MKLIMEIFDKILKLYNEIKNIYLELYKLEVSGKKEDVTFLELVNLLKERVMKEEELVKELINYYNGDIYKVYSMVNGNSDIRKRLLDSINMYECINDSLVLSEEERLEQLRIDSLYISCYRNLYLIYYSFLQEYIEIFSFEDVRDYLLKFKYDNSFNEHDMENQLVINNFNVPRVNYVILNSVVDTLKLKIGNEVVLDCFAERILTSLVDLLSIKDSDYIDKEKKVSSINSQCILRAGLAMLSESDYKELINEMTGIIDTHTNGDNSISIQIINSIVDGRVKDKERIKKVSLRPLKD